MIDLGEPREFLGFKIRRDREKQVLKISQSSYIEKILKIFGFSEMHPQNTSMVTNQVINRKRNQTEEDCDEAQLEKTATKYNVPYREAVGTCCTSLIRQGHIYFVQ